MRKQRRKGLGKDKLKNYFALHGIHTAGQMGSEAVEEVLQGMTQSIVAVGSQSLLDEWRVPDLNVGIFREGGHHGGWSQVRDEIAGGLIGGGATAITGAGKIVTGLNERSLNSSIAKLARQQEGIKYTAKRRSSKDIKAGKSKWHLSGTLTEKMKMEH